MGAGPSGEGVGAAGGDVVLRPFVAVGRNEDSSEVIVVALTLAAPVIGVRVLAGVGKVDSPESIGVGDGGGVVGVGGTAVVGDIETS